MIGRTIGLLACLAAAGCGTNSLSIDQDSNMQSSLVYDTVPCPSLIARRNALAASYGLPRDAKTVFGDTSTLGAVTPDFRSKQQRASEKARGQVDAMTRSITRRCVGKPTKGLG